MKKVVPYTIFLKKKAVGVRRVRYRSNLIHAVYIRKREAIKAEYTLFNNSLFTYKLEEKKNASAVSLLYSVLVMPLLL